MIEYSFAMERSHLSLPSSFALSSHLHPPYPPVCILSVHAQWSCKASDIATRNGHEQLADLCASLENKCGSKRKLKSGVSKARIVSAASRHSSHLVNDSGAQPT